MNNMHKKLRYAILSAVVVVIVSAVAYLALRSGGGQREMGLVGPKEPPPR
jgi:hypothetical protein